MSESKLPIVALHENASAFFEKVIAKHPTNMECKKGCAKCCETDISVFAIEADRIEKWFLSLTRSAQEELKTLWATPEKEGSCAFLYADQCTVYEPRPIICRTQGLPLFLESEALLDYCPLNFKAGDPPKEDWLNLERLNTILSMAANAYAQNERIKLRALKSKLINLFE